MEFCSSLAESSVLEEACDAVASEMRRVLGEGGLDLAIVFVSTRYGPMLDRLPHLLHERMSIRTLVGCTGAGLLHQNGMSAEPGLAVMAGRLPGAEVAATAIVNAELPHADAPPAAWRALLPKTELPVRGLQVLGEPFQCDMRALLAGLDFAMPEVPKVGGLASGSNHPDGNGLFLGRQRIGSGAVLLSLAGAVDVEPVVAQGCRPIGRPGRITQADRNRLVSVDDKPVRSFITEQLATLGEADMPLAEGSLLFLGIASNPFAVEEPTAGDFLVRNVLGIDERGHLVVGEHLAIGRAVQLHLRDGDSGLQDLEHQLTRSRAASAKAALMFRCIGRDGADHERFAALCPDVPLAGCTCNGEIGPVGDTTHLHGYTASCLLLREERSRA